MQIKSFIYNPSFLSCFFADYVTNPNIQISSIQQRKLLYSASEL